MCFIHYNSSAPLSGSFIIIESSFCNDLIALDSNLFKFGFNLLFLLVFGNSSTVVTNLSRAAFLSEGGMKSLLFLTGDLSNLSVPSKYSRSLSFLLNSFKSSERFSLFPTDGIGVNLSPLFSKVISESFNYLADRFTIFISVRSLFNTECFCLSAATSAPTPT